MRIRVKTDPREIVKDYCSENGIEFISVDNSGIFYYVIVNEADPGIDKYIVEASTSANAERAVAMTFYTFNTEVVEIEK